MAQAKIEAQWSIHLERYRSTVVDGYTLRVTNTRTDGGWGPIRWWITDPQGCPFRAGEVWQGTRYSALVRQAMFDAEQSLKGGTK